MTRRLISSAVMALIVAGGLAGAAHPAVAVTGDGSAGLSLPFGTGQSWALLAGPHDWNGTPDDSPSTEWNSLDLTCPTITATCNGSVAAARGGVVHFDTCGANSNYVRIDHLDGWNTSYYHLSNVQVSEGQTVARGQSLGTVGTGTACGGTASEAHVHFSLWYAPSGFSLASDLAEDPEQHGFDGVDVGGWTVHAGAAQYDGCMVRDRDGLSECSGSQAAITNDGTIGSGRPATAGNLLSSASFEAGSQDGWQWGGLDHATYNVRDATHSPHDGNWFLQVAASQSGGFYDQTIGRIPVPGESYVFSAWMRSPTGGPVATCLFLVANGGQDESTPLCVTVANTVWTEYRVPLDVHLGGHTSMTAGWTVQTTNLVLDVDSTRVSNVMLESASFEAGRVDGWGVSSMNRSTYSTTAAEGAWYLEVNALTSDGSSSISQHLPSPQPGQSYLFSSLLRSPSSQPVATCMVLSADGGSTESIPLCLTVSSPTWTRYTVPLDVHLSGHTQMTAGWTVSTAGVNLDIDGAQVVSAGLASASFEAGRQDGWTSSNANHVPYAPTDAQHAAIQGAWFMELNAIPASSAGYWAQDVDLAPQPGDSYTFTVWLRSPTGLPVSVCLDLAADGGADESTPLCVAVSSTTWSLYSVPLDVHQAGHRLVTAAITLVTTGINLDVDGASVDISSRAQPLASTNNLFVRRAYLDLLGRPADSGGLGFWTGAIDDNAPLGQIAAIFTSSQEYRAATISALYTHYLQRPVDPPGLQYWLGFIGSGGTYEQLIAGLTGSDEYFTLHGGGQNPPTHIDTFVQAVYADVLNRAADSAGLAYWDQQLAAGAPRSSVTAAFTVSLEYYRLLVSSDYLKLLRRTADPSGLDYWTTQFQNGARDETMIANFVGSGEYYRYAVTHP